MVSRTVREKCSNSGQMRGRNADQTGLLSAELLKRFYYASALGAPQEGTIQAL